MKRMEAYGYLKALLEGVDPLTGELLPDDHVCCDENVCEAIEMATKALCSMKDEWFGTLNAEPVRKKQQPQTDEQADAGWVKKNGKLSASRPWTEQDCAVLKKLFLDGADMEKICRQLQRRHRGVETKLYEMGLIGESKLSRPRKQQQPGLEKRGLPWSVEDDRLLRHMYASQIPAAEIAHALQRTEYAVYCHMERLGLTGDVDGYPKETEMDDWSDDEMLLMRDLHARGFSAEEIAEELERPLPSVKGRLFAAGLSREAPFSLRNRS